jgi:MFS-type transporter involved in bile tolerance (Atg22 family)
MPLHVLINGHFTHVSRILIIGNQIANLINDFFGYYNLMSQFQMEIMSSLLVSTFQEISNDMIGAQFGPN